MGDSRLSPQCGQLFLLEKGLGLYPGFNSTERKSSFNSFLFGIPGKEISSWDLQSAKPSFHKPPPRRAPGPAGVWPSRARGAAEPWEGAGGPLLTR